MKALSLFQPWASLCAGGMKRFETRSWQTPYRGPLAIHASKALPLAARDMWYVPDCREALAELGFKSVQELPRGVIIAVVNLVDCRRTEQVRPRGRERSFGDFTRGRYAWELRDVVLLATPLPARGSLGLWDVPVELLEAMPTPATPPLTQLVLEGV